LTTISRALEHVPSQKERPPTVRACNAGLSQLSERPVIPVGEATNRHTCGRTAAEKNGGRQRTALRVNRDLAKPEK